MEVTRFCILSILICISFYLLLIEAQEDKKKCENMDIKVSEEDMMNLQDCVKQVGAESWDNLAQEKLPCFGKCVIQKRNLIDDMGVPHVENIVTAVNDSLPEIVRGDLVIRIETCLNDHASKVDPKEESCESYNPLMSCIHISFMEVCSSQ